MNEWNAGELCRGVAAGGGEWKVSHCNGADRLLFPVEAVRARSDETSKQGHSSQIRETKQMMNK